VSGPASEPVAAPATAQDLLDQILVPDPPPFALLHRPDANGLGALDLLVGELHTVESLAELPVPDGAGTPGRHEVLAVIPYRQIAERGFDSVDDGAPLLAIEVTEQASLSTVDALRLLPDMPIRTTGGRFDVGDDEYAELVRRVIEDEIGTGEGANFVVRRTYTARISDYGPRTALSLFRRLMGGETGAYWTFVVHTGEHTFVGATPERHVSLLAGKAVMTPISGTYRYPPSGPELAEVMAFLRDGKETDELYMVLDEELKMMGRICSAGGRVTGPYLREMARLAHTEYYIEGHSTRDPREILRETMFSPAVTGSPLESACQVIARYEPHGRGYYSGVLALIGRDEAGGRTMDSAILIRAADIDRGGRMRIDTGATLVRHSDPDSEVAETRAKAAGLLAALADERSGRLSDTPEVLSALAARNATIAEFWLAEAERAQDPVSGLRGRQVLVVDAEDTFTAMIGHQLRALGLDVTLRRFDEQYSFDGYDVVVMGPGPGDPRVAEHPKIVHLRAAIDDLLATGKPFLAVCLSHQTLCTRLGLELVRRERPNQGTQREIDLFGDRQLVGFYNTFVAVAPDDKLECPGIGMVELCRDPDFGEVYALRGPHFAAMQFHAESVLTRNGPHILSSRLRELLGT
jgi:2-amino-4-deoxychorismate synthase